MSINRDHISYQVSANGVADVWLNRPDVHNAFNPEMINELTQVFATLEENPTARVIVLSGRGESFCAGADLTWMQSQRSANIDDNVKDSWRLAELFYQLNNCSLPLIGKIQGLALGGGAGLAAVCDVVVAEETAMFGFTEVRLGLLPAVISPFVIAKIGEGRARELFISGRRFSAEKAKEVGLVHEVVKELSLDDAVHQVTEEFLQAAPDAMRNAKRLISDVSYLMHHAKSDEALTDYCCTAIAEARVSKEGQEGMSALLEKRKPSWLQGD